MNKLLAATSATFLLTNIAIAPAFAESLAQQTGPTTQHQIILPQGEMMTDVELASQPQTENSAHLDDIALGASGRGAGPRPPRG